MRMPTTECPIGRSLGPETFDGFAGLACVLLGMATDVRMWTNVPTALPAVSTPVKTRTPGKQVNPFSMSYIYKRST